MKTKRTLIFTFWRFVKWEKTGTLSTSIKLIKSLYQTESFNQPTVTALSAYVYEEYEENE